MVSGKKHQKKKGFADNSFHGPTVDLQIHKFLEWAPDHQEFVFIEMVQKESLAKWYKPLFSHVSNEIIKTSLQ